MTGTEQTSAEVWAWFEDVRRLEKRMPHDEAVRRAHAFHGFTPEAYAREKADAAERTEAAQ